MARGARTIKVDNDGKDVEVTLWVDQDGAQQISIQDEGLDDFFDVEVALAIGRAIRRLAKWAETEKGKKRIAACRKKEQEDYHR